MNLMQRFRAILKRLRASSAVGHVDVIENGFVLGWAFAPGNPQRRLLVDVFVDEAFAGQARANLRREDLVAASIGDGAYGFALNIGYALNGPNANVEAYVVGARRIALPSALCVRQSDVSSGHCATATAYLRITFAGLQSQAPHAPPKRFAHLADERFYERLVAPSPNSAPPTCLGRPIGAYQDLVRHCWNQADMFEPSLVPAQSLDFLKWYLSLYGRMRGAHRAPLSADDIAFLTQSIASDADISRAQEMFADNFAFESPQISAVQRRFLWVAYDAATLSVEDCLIGPMNGEALNAVDEPLNEEPYPLTTFMLLFLSNNPVLCGLPLKAADQRAFAYFATLLFSITAPHFLMFVPAKWRDMLLEPQAKDACLFDSLSIAIFGGNCPINAEHWRHMIAARNFDLTTNRFATQTNRGSRIYAAAQVVSNTEIADVQVIGPFTRELGVGQSCRRLARALQSTGYHIRNCEFSLDHPNESRQSDGILLSDPGSARINIVHLNLEDLPKAVAYGPDVFTDAFNISFPYFELAPLGPTHSMGLSFVDEVWAASQFIADTLTPYTPLVSVVGGAVEDAKPLGHARAREIAYGAIAAPDEFIFLTAGDALSGADRKNPLGVARAFLHAFPDRARVRLVIKTHSIEKVQSRLDQAMWRAVRQLCIADSRISLIDALLDAQAHTALIEGADALVSLHRSEGFGYHVLEAMALGVPVIATAYSGNVDFCTESSAFLVPYELIPVAPDHYPRVKAGQVWAEPDHLAAVRQMRRVYFDRTVRAEIVDGARSLVQRKFSNSAYARRLKARLDSIFAAMQNSP